MTKPKTDKKKTRTRNPAKASETREVNPTENPRTKREPEPTESREDLVVFAFRLTEAERDLIHLAAGPGKASKYVRSLAVAAATGDEDAVKGILQHAAKA